MKTCLESPIHSGVRSVQDPRQLSRRQALRVLTGAGLVAALGPLPARSEPPPSRLGVCSISYWLRWPDVTRGQGDQRDMFRFIEHCQQVGVGGIQTSLPADTSLIPLLRNKVEAAGMYFEGQIRLPREGLDVERFEAQVRAAKEAGITVLRTACLGGRRYETFKTLQEFADFTERSERALATAEPIAKKHHVHLAVENHKDWRVPEMLRLLRVFESEYIGVCVDTGNSIALLEHPMAVIEAYAPYALSVHLKDMGVREYESGFLLSEVPLGEGFLDLGAIIATLRRAKPDLRFSLEMITRDPLKVPCLTKEFWATFESLPGWFLASTLAMVRHHSSKQPLPQVTGLTREETLELEDQAVKRSLAYARDTLRL